MINKYTIKEIKEIQNSNKLELLELIMQKMDIDEPSKRTIHNWNCIAEAKEIITSSKEYWEKSVNKKLKNEKQ